jgi:hypothetical protein
VAVCPDCGEKLAAKLPEQNVEEKPDQDWVPLARLTSQQTAEMLRGALEAKGIPAVLHSGTGHFGVTGQMGISSFRPVGGGYVIFVPVVFVEDANCEAEVILGDDWEKLKIVDIK